MTATFAPQTTTAQTARAPALKQLAQLRLRELFAPT